jgi:PAS domain-containing protein
MTPPTGDVKGPRGWGSGEPSSGAEARPHGLAPAPNHGTIPERRLLEEELREARAKLVAQEQRFHSIVERSVDGVIVLDPQGWVLFANAAAEGLFGRERRELIGTDFGYPAVAGEITEIDILPAVGRCSVGWKSGRSGWGGAPRRRASSIPERPSSSRT